ncbi:MAG TPA: transglycosylase SLT domain-containing protein [Bryobacteraceae bacterium]|nr:transglycosylase SLT domain-containing protein [Bryobacteraceae bacterium]
MRSTFAATLLVPLLVPQFGWLSRRPVSFTPSTTLSGIGAGRETISDAVLARRAELMIESQTFAIMRDPEALAGAERITRLEPLFRQAGNVSGLPPQLIAAIAYLESWGKPNAQSYAGPKGMMQISGATAQMMGLRMIYGKRYRTVVERRQVRKKGKLLWQKQTRRIPYQVLLRDERLIPAKAVPAAARYLARLDQQYGRDWAVFAYHCGTGCMTEMRAIAERAGVKQPITVARTFFGAHPGLRRELYDALQHHMERDYSPTYWFRIMRAQQLLELYRTKPAEFTRLFEQYRNRTNPIQRAPHRLSVWLTPEDLAFNNCEELRKESGRSLVRAFDNPEFFGFALSPLIGRDDPVNRDLYHHVSPAALGTLAYIAYETRRLHEAMKPRGEKFVPLQITSLVVPRDAEQNRQTGRDFVSHCTGQVFDISWANLPNGQREALEFVMNDMGWDGYLGFIRRSGAESEYQVGAAPTARDFFLRVYDEAVAKTRESD